MEDQSDEPGFPDERLTRRLLIVRASKILTLGAALGPAGSFAAATEARAQGMDRNPFDSSGPGREGRRRTYGGVSDQDQSDRLGRGHSPRRPGTDHDPSDNPGRSRRR